MRLLAALGPPFLPEEVTSPSTQFITKSLGRSTGSLFGPLDSTTSMSPLGRV